MRSSWRCRSDKTVTTDLVSPRSSLSGNGNGFTLPLQRRFHTIKLVSSGGTTTSHSGPLSVLWVDADVEFVRPLATFLRGRECETTLVTNGKAATDAVRSRAFDVVLLEWRLPDGSGADILRHLVQCAKETPVAVLSHWADLDLARQAGALGACAVRRKPVHCIELLNLVRHVASLGAAPQPSAVSWADRMRSMIETATRGSDRQTVLRRAAVVLTEPAVSIPETAAGMRVFCTLTSDCLSPEHRIGRARDILEQALRHLTRVDPIVSHAIVLFESSGGERLSEMDVARTLRVSSGHLGRLLAAQTHLSWRHWRTTSRFREVFRDLRYSNALLKTLALTHHWGSYEQFSHEFRARMGMPAREFRLLLRHDDEVQVLDNSLQAAVN